jgi:hypothetical protein
MMNYIITGFAIAGLFVNPKFPCRSFFMWSGTNLYWTIYAFRCSDHAQGIMFMVFTASCIIQYFRLPWTPSDELPN